MVAPPVIQGLVVATFVGRRGGDGEGYVADVDGAVDHLSFRETINGLAVRIGDDDFAFGKIVGRSPEPKVDSAECEVRILCPNGTGQIDAQNSANIRAPHARHFDASLIASNGEEASRRAGRLGSWAALGARSLSFVGALSCWDKGAFGHHAHCFQDKWRIVGQLAAHSADAFRFPGGRDRARALPCGAPLCKDPSCCLRGAAAEVWGSASRMCSFGGFQPPGRGIFLDSGALAPALAAVIVATK